MIYCEIDKGRDPKPTPKGMVHQFYYDSRREATSKGCRDVPDKPSGQADKPALPHVVKWGRLCPSCGYRPWRRFQDDSRYELSESYHAWDRGWEVEPIRP